MISASEISIQTNNSVLFLGFSHHWFLSVARREWKVRRKVEKLKKWQLQNNLYETKTGENDFKS